MDYKELLLPYQKLLDEAGADRKYSASGIYCIKIDDKIAYIGKSTNMYNRIASHIEHIEEPLSKEFNGKKYKLLRQARYSNHKIGFDVLLYCKEEDLTAAEGEYIRKYLPPLNTQIPKVGGGWEVNNIKSLTLPQLLSLLEDRKN